MEDDYRLWLETQAPACSVCEGEGGWYEANEWIECEDCGGTGIEGGVEEDE